MTKSLGKLVNGRKGTLTNRPKLNGPFLARSVPLAVIKHAIGRPYARYCAPTHIANIAFIADSPANVSNPIRNATNAQAQTAITGVRVYGCIL